MKRGTAKRLLTACLTLGAATALATKAQAQDTSQTGAAPMPQDTAPTTPAAGDTLGGDSTKWGYPVDTSKAQNPPGYRGMETPAGVDSAERAAGDSGVSADSSVPDTTAAGQEQPYEPNSPEKRMHPDSIARSDTSSQ